MSDIADIETDSGTTTSEATNAQVTTSANDSVPLKRFTNLQSKYDTDTARYKTRIQQLESQVDKLQGDHEGELSELRRSKTSVEDATKTLRDERDAALLKVTQFENEIKRTAAEKALRKLITDNYGGLLTDFDKGYLKTADEFASEDDFKAYLEYQNSKIATDTKQKLPNTPSAPDGRFREGASKSSVEEIMTEIAKLDTRIPGNLEKRNALYLELNTIG